jgi:hypothetical protein
LGFASLKEYVSKKGLCYVDLSDGNPVLTRSCASSSKVVKLSCRFHTRPFSPSSSFPQNSGPAAVIQKGHLQQLFIFRVYGMGCNFIAVLEAR